MDKDAAIADLMVAATVTTAVVVIAEEIAMAMVVDRVLGLAIQKAIPEPPVKAGSNKVIIETTMMISADAVVVDKSFVFDVYGVYPKNGDNCISVFIFCVKSSGGSASRFRIGI